MKLRAISDDDKSARRNAILLAASDLLDKAGYHDISIAHIARRAGLAKGTIFLYFKTKEELFLQLQMMEYTTWFEDVNRRLHDLLGHKKKIGVAEFVKTIIVSIKNYPTMVRMAPLIHVILEHNIDYKTALEFKRFLLAHIRTTGVLIERCLPFLRTNGGPLFLLDLHVLIIGVVQISSPAPLIKRVIEKEGMNVFLVKFENKLEEMLVALLTGMKAGGW
jgi:TetR/AcrR family transcriptional regulator